MSTNERDTPMERDDDILAAEYVLGVLPTDERKVVARRLVEDQSIANRVSEWQARLAPFNDDYSPVSPPPGIKEQINQRLFGEKLLVTADATARTGLFSPAYWWGFATATLAAILVAVAMLVTPFGERSSTGDALLASLSGEGDVRYLAFYTPGDGELRLAHQHGNRPEGREFELWLIEPDTPPRSLGVIAPGATVRLALPDRAAQRIAAGGVLAISIEPGGGSPTGSPTGPVVATGPLSKV